MSSERDALGSIAVNQPLPGRATPAAAKLYPIFDDSRESRLYAQGERDMPAPRAAKSIAQDTRRDARKRLRTSSGEPSSYKRESIAQYFIPHVSRRTRHLFKATLPPISQRTEAMPWRRRRRRLGQLDAAARTWHTSDHSFSSLVTCHNDPLGLLPWTITLPSFNCPTGHQRYFDPALTLAFNHSAKCLTAGEARSAGLRRLLAIGGEEGGIRVVDVDLPLRGESSTERMWNAHSNGIFDLKWTSDDQRLLSASADQTLRLHDMEGPNPQLLATLVGHTSTIKSTTFMDTTRTMGTPSAGSIIASGGRDGNIHIYDLRCRGFHDSNRWPRSSRRSMAATYGGDPERTQDILPVMTLRQPHNNTCGRRSSSDPRSVSRTITSIVALQSMPGILATGGSFDGVIKLWDVRYHASASSQRPKVTPYGTLPDPTTSGANPSRRPRSVNALCEHPSTGDLYALCGDSRVHVLRPSAAYGGSANDADAILPVKYEHPHLFARSFYVRMSLSADGRYLACGSSHGAIIAWDTDDTSRRASRIPVSQTTSSFNAEVIAVEWGKDLLSASSDDSCTRIWRADPKTAHRLRYCQDQSMAEWSGMDYESSHI